VKLRERYKMQKFSEIINAAKDNKPARVFITPFHANAPLDALCDTAERGICFPIIIGNKKTILTHLQRRNQNNLQCEIINEPDEKKARELAVSLVKEDKHNILMMDQPCHETDMSVIFNNKKDIKKTSHISVLKSPRHDKLILISDTLMHIKPDIKQKITITENMLKLALILKIKEPKAAALSAIEYVNPAIPSTIDAAILSKMSQRKQFGKCLIEGPLDIDTAVSSEAARRKDVDSPVTGYADIYIVPDSETGISLSQTLALIGKLPMACILMGTEYGVILNLPFISKGNKLVEIALLKLVLQAQDGK